LQAHGLSGDEASASTDTELATGRDHRDRGRGASDRHPDRRDHWPTLGSEAGRENAPV